MTLFTLFFLTIHHKSTGKRRSLQPILYNLLEETKHRPEVLLDEKCTLGLNSDHSLGKDGLAIMVFDRLRICKSKQTAAGSPLRYRPYQALLPRRTQPWWCAIRTSPNAGGRSFSRPDQSRDATATQSGRSQKLQFPTPLNCLTLYMHWNRPKDFSWSVEPLTASSFPTPSTWKGPWNGEGCSSSP